MLTNDETVPTAKSLDPLRYINKENSMKYVNHIKWKLLARCRKKMGIFFPYHYSTNPLQ